MADETRDAAIKCKSDGHRCVCGWPDRPCIARTPDAATVPREQYERMVALLDQAVETLDIATDAIAAGSEMPKRAVLTAKLATATHELRVAVGEAIGGVNAAS